MNNISQISKAKRLTEEEVHAAAEELQSTGSKVGSIDVYRHLGRGSLTTITNFLKTWHQEEKEAAVPALIMLPETLKKSAEQLIVKVWSESQALAEQELKSQQEALRQAEALANEKIAEAEAFSEEQAAQIDALEANIEELKKEIKDEQETRHQVTIRDAVSTEKLKETERRLDHLNAALIEQQKANQALTAENTALKTKLEANEQKLEKSGIDLKKAEERSMTLEALNKKTEVKNEVQQNQIDQLAINLKDQKEITAIEANDNKALREKAAKLEGELIAWKEIKPEAKKADAGRNAANRNNIKKKSPAGEKKEFKQTEWPEEKTSG